MKDLKTCTTINDKDLSRILNCSTDKNIVFNATNTKFKVLTTAYIKTYHKLDETKDLEIKCMEKQLELVNEWKL